MPSAYITSIDGSLAEYTRTIAAGLERIGFGDSIPPNAKIFLKPNLTFPEYRPGVMSSPRAVEGAILALKEYSDQIWVGDSDSGGYNPFPMEDVYKETGIADFASKHGAEVVNLSRLEAREVKIPLRRGAVDVMLPKLLLDETDFLVTLPVPKLHMNTGVSLTFKNQWGCIPRPTDRLRLHPRFADVILGVNQAVRARYAIIDGFYGLNSSGPMKGDAVELRWLCITDDLGAGAALCCRMMQVDLARIRHLRLARKRGLIPSLDAIDLSGDMKDFRGPPFRLKRKWTDWPGYLAFRSRPLAHLAYFSRFADPLHRLLYRFRDPFYDYDRYK